jgi:hypothetical protein
MSNAHSISHSGSQSQQQQQQQHTLRVCVPVVVGGGGPKGGPFLGTSGRTWDMKKNNWVPKLFYDNMPAHGGSTPRPSSQDSMAALRAPVVGDIVICRFHDNGVRWILVEKSAGLATIAPVAHPRQLIPFIPSDFV